MEKDEWLTSWRDIGKYIGKSAKTAQRYAREGMPFFRDPGGIPIAKPSMIDEYILEFDQCKYDDKTWLDKGDTDLGYEENKGNKQKEFDERVLEAKRPAKSRF